MKEFSYPSKHGKLRGVIWDKVKNPIATIQIFHGLVEYHARYDETAKFLNKNKVMITLATAHPSKFIDSVQSAIGKMIAQPIEMKQLYSKTERVIHAPNEINFYKNYINREI